VSDGPARTIYVGLVTRTLAFGIDAALINIIAIAAAAIVTLALSIITLPDALRVIAAAVGGALYLVWVAGYFVVFWTTTGQTPGDRLFHIRVRTASGAPLRPRRALVRFVALTLAAIPLFAGYLMILVDARRRGLHDRIARTEVVEAELPESTSPSSAARATAAERDETPSLR
jgi:uncharacterized RDD family membrane protein YckC